MLRKKNTRSPNECLVEGSASLSFTIPCSSKERRLSTMRSSFLKFEIHLSFSSALEACRTMVPVALLEIRKTFLAPMPLVASGTFLTEYSPAMSGSTCTTYLVLSASPSAEPGRTTCLVKRKMSLKKKQ